MFVFAGMACCCQYTYDQQWYRAEILDIQDDQCTVLYVDYGNAETKPLSRLVHFKYFSYAVEPLLVDTSASRMPLY
jgi:hypothetical protein